MSTTKPTPALTLDIVRDPEVRAGAPTLRGTRTAIHDIVSYAEVYAGDLARVAEEALPHLSLAEVKAAMAWYEQNREEIDLRLKRRRAPIEGPGVQKRSLEELKARR